MNIEETYIGVIQDLEKNLAEYAGKPNADEKRVKSNFQLINTLRQYHNAKQSPKKQPSTNETNEKLKLIISLLGFGEKFIEFFNDIPIDLLRSIAEIYRLYDQTIESPEDLRSIGVFAWFVQQSIETEISETTMDLLSQQLQDHTINYEKATQLAESQSENITQKWHTLKCYEFAVRLYQMAILRKEPPSSPSIGQVINLINQNN